MLLRHDFISGPDILALARRLRKARASCFLNFPRKIFRDAVWDILLELFIAEEERRILCVKDVMMLSGESQTGTIRRLEELESADLILRRADDLDHRRTLVMLTATGREGMLYLLHQLYGIGPQAVNGC